VLFVVGIEREDEPAIISHVPHETCAAGVKIVVAIGLANSVLLPVIVIEIIAKRPERAVHFCVIAIIPVAAKHVPGREMERRIQARHFHDEVDCSSGLAPELQSRARPNQFNPLYRVEDWCVMGFGKTELLVFERHTVFQHLRELAALRIQAAIPKVNNRRLGLFADDYAGCSGQHLSKIVAGEGRELSRFHEGGFLASIDPGSFDWQQRRVLDRINVERSCNDDAFRISRFGDVRYRQRQALA